MSQQEQSSQEKKLVKIVVNGIEHPWPKGKIDYDEVVTLDVPDYAQHPDITYSVMYEHGHSNSEGTLSKGGSVEVVDGMFFTVTRTGES